MAKKLKGNAGENENSAMPAVETDYKDAEALPALLRDTLRKANRPLRMDELLRIAHLPRKAKKRVENALHDLQEQGRAVRASGGWASPARTRHVEGVLAVLPSGTGFVSPKHGGADIYIHPAGMNDAWHGDSVEVLLLPGKRGPHAEGRVSRVLHRAQAELPAHALRPQKHGQWICSPANPRLQALFVADVSKLDKPVSEGNLLLLRPGGKAGPNLWEAEATVNLEHEESPRAQERITKSNHGIPGPFPAEVLHALRDLPEDPRERDFADRRDARDVDFVTIDGRAARDFDDAVHVEAQKDGFRLRVAIADVSHYVRPNTPLDAEARQRGNSYYFPLSVEPMLPEALSNGLCSLKPAVPRLAMVADMRFSASGSRRSAEFYPAVIQSRARLTYGQIQRGLLLRDEDEARNLAPALPMLREAEALARALLERRQERGTLDFDLPEAAYLFDEQGELSGLAARERHFGHRMIEEFMIAANEAVAEFLEAREIPALYRVHQPPDPDKLAVLADFLARSGLDAGEGKPDGRKGYHKAALSGRDLRRILEQSRNTPGEYVITRLVLRSMMQARYQPENEGHFGLASECYCHFTSPIRRYADLVVHRALKRALGLSVPAGEKPLPQAGKDAAGLCPARTWGERGATLSGMKLEAVAEHLNATERAATEAEREIHRRLSILFLRGREEESFDAVISGLTDFGLFVELPEFLCEGMIRLASLEDDYYDYVEERQEIRGRRTGRTFRLGRALRVTLADVSMGRLELNFVLEENADASPGKGGAGTRRLRDGIRLAGPGKAGRAGRPGRGKGIKRFQAERVAAGAVKRAGAGSACFYRKRRRCHCALPWP